MNCLLLREFPKNISPLLRLWDTYLSDENFAILHPFVCAAFLEKWATQLKEMDFSSFMTFIQKPPTMNWDEEEISVMISEAFVLQAKFNV